MDYIDKNLIIESNITKIEYERTQPTKTVCRITLTNGTTYEGWDGLGKVEDYNKEVCEQVAYRSCIDYHIMPIFDELFPEVIE